MAAGTRICKICGKEYPYCKTFNATNAYRWQDVACCPEHAAIYFTKIAESRNEDAVFEVNEYKNGVIKKAKEAPKKASPAPKKEPKETAKKEVKEATKKTPKAKQEATKENIEK